MTTGFQWPDGQQFVSAEQARRLASSCRLAFAEGCADLRIDADLSGLLADLYIPLAAWLERRYLQHSEPLVIGLCGGQGSGKSTVATLLRTVLRVGFRRKVVSFSVDDIYKTKEERETLGQDVHPLFVTRGVPGTHDVQLGIDTLERLKTQAPDQSTSIPAFDKARDTRRGHDQWPRWVGPAEIILFEGWFVGATAQRDDELTLAINELERTEDPDGIWRRASNDALADSYQRLFEHLDVLMLLEVDSMDRVFTWRRLQERKLAARARDSGLDLAELSIMSERQVDRFIMHYERLTRHILTEMPARADIVFPLDNAHNPAKVRINCPL